MLPRPCPRTRWSACPSTTSQPGATTRPSRRPATGVYPARSPRTRPRTVSVRGHPALLHLRGWTACCLGDRPSWLPSPSPAPRWGRCSLMTASVSMEITVVTSLWWPLSASSCPWRFLGGLLSVQSLWEISEDWGVSHPAGMSQRYMSMTVLLRPELPFFCQGSWVPLTAFQSLAFQTDAPACPVPLVCPGTPVLVPSQHSERVSAPQIWVVGRERGCTLGPPGGHLVWQPLPPL